MEQQGSMLGQQTVCEVDGCDSTSTYRVARGERELSVCRRCVQEMVALFDWTVTATPIPPAHREAVAV
jgi:hypothetical protein